MRAASAKAAISSAAARWFGDRRGNLAVMSAMLLPVGVALAAVAIDSGSIYTERRALQANADVAAITAAANIANAQSAVALTLADNNIAGVRFATGEGDTAPPQQGETVARVVPGHYEPSNPAATRFVADGRPFNAVQVSLQRKATLFFGNGLMAPPVMSAQGIAQISANAAFSIGSRLLRVDDGILNAILSGLLGGNISLTAMDYDALAKADISLLDALDSLATQAHVTTGTYNDLLASQVTVGDLAEAVANVPGLERRSELALDLIGRRASIRPTLSLGKLFDLGPAGNLSVGGRPAALTATVNALQMVTAAAAIANGKNQVALNLGAGVPGLLGVTLDLAVGEPPQSVPWFAIGGTGTLVRTAQTRLLLTVEIGSSGILGTSVKLPVYVELAYGEAVITDISCVAGKPSTLKVAISATPGIAEIRIADISATALANFDRKPAIEPASLVKLPLISITGNALIDIKNLAPTKLVFSKKDIDDKVVKSASTRDIAQSLTGSLLNNLNVTVKVIGLDLGLSALLKSTLSATLALASPLVDQVLDGLLTALGVNIGEVDVRVTGATCGRSVLVQ